MAFLKESGVPKKIFLVLFAVLVIAGIVFVLLTLAKPKEEAEGNDQVVLEGELEIVHEDHEEADAFSKSVFQYFINTTAKQRVELIFDGEGPEDLLTGSRIVVQGEETDRERVRVRNARSDIAVLKAVRPRLTARKVAVLMFNFTNNTSQPITAATARGVVYTNTNSVDNYYKEISYDIRSVIGKNDVDGASDVYGWFAINDDNAGCAFDSWGSQARQAAAAAGADLSGYDHIVHLFPNASSCGWAGVAYLGGQYSYINGGSYFTTRIVGHELGHNFGVHHSSSMSCTDGSGNRVSLSSTCTQSEYGDPFDIMGASLRHMNNFQKGRLLWYQGSNTKTVTASGDYTVVPQEISSSGIIALRIPRVIDSQGRVSQYIYAEFRQPLGFDNFSSSAPVVNGVSIRLGPEYTTLARPLLLDMTPSTTSFSDSALAVGQKFTDSERNISIETISVSSQGAVVRVTVDSTDTSPPSAPANLRTTQVQSSSAALAWDASTDNVAVGGYKVYRGSAQIATTSNTSYTDNGVSPGTSYTYTVRSYDTSANESEPSNAVTVATPASDDTTPPSAPTSLTSTGATDTTIDLAWNASTDNVGVVSYRIYRQAKRGTWSLVTTASGTSFTDTGLRKSKSYTYQVTALDAAGNESAPSESYTAQTTGLVRGGRGKGPNK